MLWDAHCHLHDERITDREQQIQEALSLGIKRWVVCSTGPDDWSVVNSLCREKQFFIAAYGVHPWYLDNLPHQWEEKLYTLVKNTPSLIGECGLDFEREDQKLQEEVFQTQIIIAAELQRPLNIHCRKAWHRLFPILQPYLSKIPFFIIHAFSHNLHIAREVLKRGGYLSFASSILRPWNQERFSKLFQEIPLSGILVETDAPDIPLYSPETGLSGLSRLSHLELVASQICEWKSIEREKLEAYLEKQWMQILSLFQTPS
ncbi:TatD family hydrolase [Thermospira aquatica]|uniref:TatD family hydrolase n=1 Tax=Thermospira aquatica TaxID=2828656 RepID=A0AAX3BCL3_9SPIR|nr:TatD family hydrolase [Thermospira aquatica]URA09843.1 TatD family hydrolase [Thermospira aquatica]